MAHKQNNPGCPCCDCLIYATDFGSDVIADFTVTGTGSVSSGALELTGTSTLAILDTAHPQYPYPPRVRASVKGGTGAELRIVLSYSTASGGSGIIVELRPNAAAGCGELDIYKLASGSESLLSGTHDIPGLIADQWHSVAACYDPRDGSITVRVRTYDGRDSTISSSISGHTYGEYAGLGTGDGHSGTGYFDNLQFQRLWYYGDGEQDDWATNYYYDSQVIECSSCQSDNCAYIDANFADTEGTCEWTGAISDWAIADSALGTDGSGADNSIILHRAAYARDDRTDPLGGNYLQIGTGTQNNYTFDVDHYHRVLLTITFTASYGSTFYGIICATDSDNYTAVEVTVGDAATEYCGTVKLIAVASGVATDISDEHVVPYLLSGITHILQINYYDGYVVAQIGDRTLGYGIQMRAQATYGVYVGLGATGDSVAVTEFEAGCRQIIESCQLDSGTFDYDATQWRTCKWSKLSGTWPTRDANDRLLVDANAELLFLNPVPVPYRGAHKVILTGAISLSAQDDTAASIIFGSDSTGTNYYEAKLNYAAAGSTITLYKVNSGVPTQLATSATSLPYPFILTACCAGGKVYAVVYQGSGIEATGESYGGFTGFAGEIPVYASSGDLIVTTYTTHRIRAGVNSWDSFFLQNCTRCGTPPVCATCATGNTAPQYQITVVGFDSEKCTSAFCDINRTVIADTDGCFAQYSYSPDPQPTCELKLLGSLVTTTLELILYSIEFVTIGSTRYLRGVVELQRPGVLSRTILQYNFLKVLTAPYDCEDVYLEELPLTGITNSLLSAPPPDWPCWPGYDEYIAFSLGNDPGTNAVKMYVSSL